MRSRRVVNIKDYLAPDSSAWGKIKAEKISMMATPLTMQPTEYIRQSWENRPYGSTESIEVASVHDGEMWAVHARWRGVSPPGKDFSDALAVTLPVKGEPALILMGDAEAPIHILKWRANREGVSSLIATGIGQSQPGPKIKTVGKAQAQGEQWQVVIARALGAGNGVAPLRAGAKTKVGFATWLGGNDERAGIKAFSIDWAELLLDA